MSETMQYIQPAANMAMGGARVMGGDPTGAIQMGQGAMQLASSGGRSPQPTAPPPPMQKPSVQASAGPGAPSAVPPPRPSPAAVTPPAGNTPGAGAAPPSLPAPGAGATGGLPQNLSPQMLARIRQLAMQGGV